MFDHLAGALRWMNKAFLLLEIFRGARSGAKGLLEIFCSLFRIFHISSLTIFIMYISRRLALLLLIYF